MANLTESIRADLYRLFEEEDMNETACKCDGECECDEDVNEASDVDLDESDEEVTEASETDLDESDEEIEEEVETVTEETDDNGDWIKPWEKKDDDSDDDDDKVEESMDPKEVWKRDLANLYSHVFESEDELNENGDEEACEDEDEDED